MTRLAICRWLEPEMMVDNEVATDLCRDFGFGVGGHQRQEVLGVSQFVDTLAMSHWREARG